VAIAGRRVQVAAPHPERVAGAVLERLREADIAVQSLQFGVGSLEQIFLSMTGAERERP